MKPGIASSRARLALAPGRKGKQLEPWAARWLGLFGAEEGISSAGGFSRAAPSVRSGWKMGEDASDPRALLRWAVTASKRQAAW